MQTVIHLTGWLIGVAGFLLLCLFLTGLTEIAKPNNAPSKPAKPVHETGAWLALSAIAAFITVVGALLAYFTRQR